MNDYERKNYVWKEIDATMYLIEFDLKFSYYSVLCVFIAVLKIAICSFLKQILVNKEGVHI